ncbi:FAD-dependent oxidoreductase [Alkanindiges illinoisensis]|uniref:FAD-dependent oxidoreductase n=1 Tax=Alkanindiges illinoisensis TaxID=197183 RepID=UPI001F108A63|nr:FAD-dependent oxidoreductase [Alkanindiges illinoisensis]
MNQFKLPFFKQFEQGKLVFEKQRGIASVQLENRWTTTPSIRLEGGMGSLIHALAQQIPLQKILTQQQVTHLTAQGQGSIYLNTKDQTDAETVVDADYVLIALSPRLAAQPLKRTSEILRLSMDQHQQLHQTTFFGKTALLGLLANGRRIIQAIWLVPLRLQR